jgi:hypothetical protein
MSHETDRAASELRAAWDTLIARLCEARDGIDDPGRWPPPATPRNLAEGYRYVLGFLYGSLARGLGPTTEFPHFVRVIQPLNRSTIDNADATYLAAPIDGRHSYTIRGRAGDTQHWRGQAPATDRRKAPHYVIFQTPSGYAGDSGSIDELAPGSRVNCDVLDSSDLQVGKDGRFEILLAPRRPEGHTGNFMCTQAVKTRRNRDGNEVSREYTAAFVMLRELFYDWENEDLLELFIYRNDRLGAPMPPYTPELAATQMQEVGLSTRNQVYFWNEFYGVTLEAYGSKDGAPSRMMPRNEFNKSNAASLATAGGMTTNIYSGGIYELAEDEALIVELHQPIEPEYIGFHLGNLWGESLDFANHQSSLNAFQACRDPDNVLRYVIAHRDPGVANWLDTTGHAEGYMAVRWAYSRKPKDDWPWANARRVPLAEIDRHLPPGTARVTAEQRRSAIAVRQEHVQRRYRQH